MRKWRAIDRGRAKLDPDKWVEFKRVHLTEAEFTGRRFESLSATSSTFERCRFDSTRIDSASFSRSRTPTIFRECSFDNAQIRLGADGNVRFERCSFGNARLRDWYCFTLELVECSFTGTLHKIIFNGSVPPADRKEVRRERNEFHANDFAHADLVQVSFRTGIDLTDQKLPSADGYVYLSNARAALTAARMEVDSWSDPELKQDTLGLLKSLEFELEGGQEQLLLRPGELATYAPSLARAAAALRDVLDRPVASP